MSSIARFIQDWCSIEYGPTRVTQSAVEAAEAELSFTFPEPYRSDIIANGAASTTIELLDIIVDREVNMADLSQFHTPKEIVSATRDWREMGMAEDLVAFASDCSGNQFAFSRSEDDAVWFFDHDFGTNAKIANSFEAWLSKYAELKV